MGYYGFRLDYDECRTSVYTYIKKGCFDRLVFGHSLLPVHFGERLLLAGSVWATVVADRSMPMPYFQDLR